MTTIHTVASGENLTAIAALYGFRNWRVIFYAPDNEAFRKIHPDPDRLEPGDKIVIPTRSEVAFIDARMHVEYNDVPLFTQSELTCWRGSGKMVYLWKYRSGLSSFERAAGTYLRRETGLKGIPEWVDFYSSHLGLLGTRVNGWNFLFNIIASRGPAVVSKYIDNINDTHAMVMSGYDLRRDQLYLLDPAAGETFTYDDEGNATFTPGPATRSNMGKWHSVARTNLRQEVFHW